MVNFENDDSVILGLKDGHDGAVALIIGNHLEFSVEAEKDNGLRFSSVTPDVLLKIFHMAVAGAECNTVIELTQEHHIA